jgi:primosomal protein N' (replication factor Y)
VVIGTRSAVFVPMPRLGLVIVDEEHDPSFKQQDGLRYSARDVALVRAAREPAPVLLGSATPSLESLRHAREGRYRLLELPGRAGAAVLPVVIRLDLRKLAVDDGLSAPLREAIAARLQRGEQSLIFLNRRGFAPAWMCHACGWVATCPRCDARLTYHHGRRRLLCHHCSTDQPVMTRCPGCAGEETLRPLGAGTERLESALVRTFPKARLVRVDRDSTRRRGALETTLARIRAGDADILVGTQMLAKGHDFPNVTLVGIVNADQGLYAPDFRAEERLLQTILQVSGRAGRADKPGQVLIQTWHPEHPIFDALARHDFEGFSDYLLGERQAQQYPPFSHLALLRAESPAAAAPLRFLALARELAGQPASVTLFDPLPAPMERRAGRYRAQLLVQATERKPLHRFLHGWVRAIGETPEARRVRWSLDVDPLDLS